jgi:Ca-activated chloride channel homolog
VIHDFGEETKSFIIRAVAWHREGISVSDAVVSRRVALIQLEEVNRVLLWATVTDRDDKFLTELTRDDFRVLENGAPQQVIDFYPEDRPIALAILIDTSGSMRDQMPQVHAAAGAFVDTLRGEDQALVIDFDDKVYLIQDLTSDRDKLKEAITSTEAIGGTSLYDALHAAYRKLGTITGRKAIVILSDGDDTTSQFGYARMLEQAKTQGVLIYGIGLGVGRLVGRLSPLREFADATGGRAFFIRKADELADVYQRVAEELRHQYYLTYSTNIKEWDGRWIEVKVEVTRPDARVRARRGFFAVRSVGGSTVASAP